MKHMLAVMLGFLLFASSASAQSNPRDQLIISDDFNIDRSLFTTLVMGTAVTFQQQSRDHLDQEELSQRGRTFNGRWLDAAEYMGTGVPTLALVGLEYMVKDRDASAAALSSSGAFVTTHFMQQAANRRRPNGDEAGFPSGHTTMAFNTAANLYYAYGWMAGAPALAFATIVSLQRIADNRHWTSDTMAGATVGLLWARKAYADVSIDQEGHLFPFPMEGGGMGMMWAYNY